MPFLQLPKDPTALRFEDGQVSLHYTISTPSCPTFVHASAHAASFESAATPTSPARHKCPTNTRFKAVSSNGAASFQESKQKSDGKQLELDPDYPVVFFLPSECFSCVHLFANQLSDPKLAASFNLVAVDPRGHGLTKEVPIDSRSAKRYDLDVKAADILTFIQELCNRTKGDADSKTPPQWNKGFHLLAASMSSLVATRMAAKWPDTFTSIIITSPILELESPFMIESFQGIKELLEEAWQDVHGGGAQPKNVSVPGEVVQGFFYRWVGEGSIPPHIESYLRNTWLERLVLRKDGMEAARDWWFDLYWLRREMPIEDRTAVKCDMLLVEGTHHLPYDRQVGMDYKLLFPQAAKLEYKVVENAPFLLSVARPEALKDAIIDFLQAYTVKKGLSDPNSYSNSANPIVEGVIHAMTPDERFELIKVYAPDAVPAWDDEPESTDDESEEEMCEFTYEDARARSSFGPGDEKNGKIVAMVTSITTESHLIHQLDY